MKTLLLAAGLLLTIPGFAAETKGIEALIGTESLIKAETAVHEAHRAMFFVRPEEKEGKRKEFEKCREHKGVVVEQMGETLFQFIDPNKPLPFRSLTPEEQGARHDSDLHYRLSSSAITLMAAVEAQVKAEFLRKAIAAREDAWHAWYLASPEEKPEKRRQYEKHCNYASSLSWWLHDVTKRMEEHDRAWFKQKTRHNEAAGSDLSAPLSGPEAGNSDPRPSSANRAAHP